MKGKNPTKPFNVRVYCSAYYDSEIDVPANLTPKEAFQYAKDHLYDGDDGAYCNCIAEPVLMCFLQDKECDSE